MGLNVGAVQCTRWLIVSFSSIMINVVLNIFQKHHCIMFLCLFSVRLLDDWTSVSVGVFNPNINKNSVKLYINSRNLYCETFNEVGYPALVQTWMNALWLFAFTNQCSFSLHMFFQTPVRSLSPLTYDLNHFIFELEEILWRQTWDIMFKRPKTCFVRTPWPWTLTFNHPNLISSSVSRSEHFFKIFKYSLEAFFR